MRPGILITLLATGLLAGCGQKGPLYLPETAAAPARDASPAAARASQAPASDHASAHGSAHASATTPEHRAQP